MKHDEYHRQFADAIIEQIRQGTALWQKPWGPGERVLPSNVDTGRSYRGGNSLHLAAVQQERGYGDVRWGTYRQIQARDGQVRKGEQGTRILSFQDHRKIAVNDERGRPKRDNEGKRVYRHERMPQGARRPPIQRLQRRAGRRAPGPARARCRAALEGPPAGREGAPGQRGPRSATWRATARSTTLNNDEIVLPGARDSSPRPTTTTRPRYTSWGTAPATRSA